MPVNQMNQETVMEKRSLYMATPQQMSHQEYYLWLGEFIGATERHLPRVDVKASTDDSFNDIPLMLWDRRDPIIRLLASAKGLAWSLSDTVCVLKAIARKVRGK